VKKKLISIVKYLFFLSIGAALLFMVFKEVDLKRMYSEIKAADMRYVALSIIFGIIALWSRAARWLIVLEPLGHKTRLMHSLIAVNLGYFANIAFPRIGEIVRCTILYRMNGAPVTKLIGTVILERVIDLVMLFSLIGFVFLYKINFFGSFFIDFFSEKLKPLLNFNSLSGVILILSAVVILSVLLFFLWRYISKNPDNKVVIKTRSLAQEISSGFRALFRMKKKWAFIGHTLLIWSMYFLMTWICFFSYEHTALLSKIDGLFMTVVGGLGMSAPVQGGFGTFHFLVEKALMLYNIVPITDHVTGEKFSPGLVFATIVHTSQFIMVLAVGTISLIGFYIIKNKS
jgi:uncharacterized protein (TIRG00374 family)